MNIKLGITAKSSFYIKFDGKEYRYNSGIHSISLDYDPVYYIKYDICVGTDTLKEIETNCIVVNFIEFDNLWTLTEPYVAIGTNKYHQNYLDYAKDNSITVEHDIHDNNVLFFMGELVFTFYHPLQEYFSETTTLR